MEPPVGAARRFPRYPIDVPVKLSAIDGGGKLVLGRGTNLGQGGLEALVATELRTGQRVTIEITLPYHSEPFTIEAEVRNKNGYRYGLSFLPMGFSKEAVIKRVCDILALMFDHVDYETTDAAPSSAPVSSATQRIAVDRLAEPVSGAPRKRVFVVDDEPGVADVITYALKRKGFDAIAFHDPIQVLNSVNSDDPSVLVCDYGMPRMNGLSLVEEVCKRNTRCKAILMSGLPVESLEGAIQALIFIRKPVEINQLIRLIESDSNGEAVRPSPSYGTNV